MRPSGWTASAPMPSTTVVETTVPPLPNAGSRPPAAANEPACRTRPRSRTVARMRPCPAEATRRPERKDVSRGRSEPELLHEPRGQAVAVLDGQLGDPHVGPGPHLGNEPPALPRDRPEHGDRSCERRTHRF